MKINIGKYVTANPKEGMPWVTYSSSDKGEKDYYRDVYSKETSCLIYCYGETCKIEGIDEINQTVTLSNDNIDDNEYPAIFTIPFEQFEADFS